MGIEYSEVRDILQPLCVSLDGKSSMRRDGRDEWNSKVRKYLDQRNELNSRVKELIAEVQTQRLFAMRSTSWSGTSRTSGPSIRIA